MDEAGATKNPAPANFRVVVSEQLQGAAKAGRRIADKCDAVHLRLFGPLARAERPVAGAPPLGPESSIDLIFEDGIRGVRTAQEEAAATPEEILARL